MGELRTAPAPGEAPLPAADAAALLRANGTDAHRAGRPALHFEGRSWTHGDVLAEGLRWANLFLSRKPVDRPFHVGVLLDNTPDYVFALAGAALSGATVVGLNHTRRGEQLARDVTHTDVGLLVTEPRHESGSLQAIAEDLGVPPERRFTSSRFVAPDDPPATWNDLDAALAEVGGDDAGIEPGPDTRWMLIFTSGTSSAPKAVICTQRRLLVTGNRMSMLLGLDEEDVGYVCMPLFHSNALMVGWAPSLVVGASVGLARRFSASGWLPDVRRYGSTWFNYTGKPLAYLVATAEHPDDADNPVRIAFGNEGSPEVVDTFARRFGVEVIDAFGATEGGISVERREGMPAGALGLAPDHVRVVDEDGVDREVARLDERGALVNAEDCVGEIVNTRGAGPFEGYYNNPEATAAATRDGWYWSGDLGYLDEGRYLFFAGRTADWIRVDGENFPAGPILDAVAKHPDVVAAAAYGVPDVDAGDQVMATLLLRDGAELDPAAFGAWVDALEDVGPKWRPRYVRVTQAMPTTGTNKVVTRTLQHQKWRRDRIGADLVFVRLRGEAAYRPFTADDEAALLAAFEQARRRRFWDL
jgi:fatty-acyl-CoA synthase